MLGSAGGPRLALPIIGADTFFIVNGDTLTDVDLDALAAAHAASGALVTLALVPNREPDQLRRRAARRRGSGDRIRAARAIGARLVSLHRRAGGLGARRSSRFARATAANSIGGVYDG